MSTSTLLSNSCAAYYTRPAKAKCGGVSKWTDDQTIAAANFDECQSQMNGTATLTCPDIYSEPICSADHLTAEVPALALQDLTADCLTDTEALASRLKKVCLSLSKKSETRFDLSALADRFNRKLCDNDNKNSEVVRLRDSLTSRKSDLINSDQCITTTGRISPTEPKKCPSPERAVCLNDFSVLCANLIISLLNLDPPEESRLNGGNLDSSHSKKDFDIVGSNDVTLMSGLSDERLRKRVQTFRRVLHELQSLWLINTSMATGTTVKIQTELRKILMGAAFILGLIPDIVRALIPVFFVVSNESTGSSDGFINYLSHWGGTGYVQYLYEVCIILLIKMNRYDLALVSLSGIGDLGVLKCLFESKLMKIFQQDQNGFLQDKLISYRREIMACLKFPVVGFELLLEHYINSKDEEEIVLGLLSLGISRTISDKIFIYNIWQIRLIEQLNLLRQHPTIHRLSHSDIFSLLSVAGQNQTAQTTCPIIYIGQVLERIIPHFIYDDNNDDNDERLTSSVCSPKEKMKIELTVHSRQRLAMVLELCHRIVEHDWINVINRNENPIIGLMSDMTSNEEKRLQMCKRTMNGLLGCSLGRIDLLYMRILENFDQQFSGRSTGFIGLDFTNNGPLPFQQSLTLTDTTFLTLLKIQQHLINTTHGPPSFQLNVKKLILPPLPVVLPTKPTIWNKSELTQYQTNRWWRPTTLPSDQLVQSFPALLAGFHVLDPSDQSCCSARAVSDRGWKLLGFEMLVASSKRLMLVGDHRRAGVPCQHLSLRILVEILPLYIDVGNPRAVYLLSRLTNLDEEDKSAVENKDLLGNLLTFFQDMLLRAEHSGFALIADAIIDAVSLDEANDHTYQWAIRILKVYEAAKEPLKARNFIQNISNSVLSDRLQRESQIWHLDNLDKNESTSSSSTSGPMKEDRVKKALKMIKKLGAVKDVDAIMKFFHELRQSNRGITDASLLNKILHLCVTNNRFDEADQIFQCLRTEAHDNLNGVEFTANGPGLASVRPDVVTCNIVLKGLIKQLMIITSPTGNRSSSEDTTPQHCHNLPDTHRISELIDYFTTLMETPFWMGGEGVKADSITFNIAIGFAVDHQTDIQQAWAFFNLMKSKSIRVDVYTCNLIINHLDLNRDANIAKALVDILTHVKIQGEDSATLSSLVDAYTKLQEWKLLETILDHYDNTNHTKTLTSSSMIMLFKGYAICKSRDKLRRIWCRLKDCRSVRWNSSMISLICEAFTSVSDEESVAEAMEIAALTNTTLPNVIRSTAGEIKMGKERVKGVQQKNQNGASRTREQSSMSSSRSASPEDERLRAGSRTAANGTEMKDGPKSKAMQTVQKRIRSGNFEAAWQLLENAAVNGDGTADIVLYSTMIKGLCDQENIVLARKVFDMVPEHGLEYDSVIFNTMLEGYTKIGDIKNVQDIFQKLLQCSRSTPTCYTMTILVKFYGRQHLAEEVINLMDTLPVLFPIKLDSYVYTAAIAACAWNNHQHDALKYLIEMRKEHEVGIRTYGTLISGCMKCQNWQILKQVLQFSQEDKCQIDKRELNGLSDLLRSYKTGRMAKGWLNTGFGKLAAEMIHVFLNGQQQKSQRSVVFSARQRHGVPTDH